MRALDAGAMDLMNTRRLLLKLLMAAPVLASGAAAPADKFELSMQKIRPLFQPKAPPRPGDWLAEHSEPGQTYRQYREQVRTRVVDSFKSIRVVPIGPLTVGQKAVLDTTIEFMRPFFGMPLILDAAVSLEGIPDTAQRQRSTPGSRQLLTTWLLDQPLLARRKPADAAVLGITAIDLWPGAGWNFVFGQASLRDRVGVWSMSRNGDADRLESRTLCARRTVMTATHETGHMFGIRHCTAYECGMNGSNSARERDFQPLEFCPECQAKLWWALNLDPLQRSRQLEALVGRHGFTNDAAQLARQSRALATT
jgi:archaemetzincin